MSSETQQVLEQVLALTPADRVVIVEQLLLSLHQPDVDNDIAWSRVAEGRIAAYDAGRLESVPMEDVFTELMQPRRSNFWR
jgi:putative addiction module component (TIGR02574 family)